MEKFLEKWDFCESNQILQGKFKSFANSISNLFVQKTPPSSDGQNQHQTYPDANIFVSRFSSIEPPEATIFEHQIESNRVPKPNKAVQRNTAENYSLEKTRVRPKSLQKCMDDHLNRESFHPKLRQVGLTEVGPDGEIYENNLNYQAFKWVKLNVIDFAPIAIYN
jgi:hypothetical protein